MRKNLVISVLILSVSSGCATAILTLKFIALPLAKHLLFDRGHETPDSNEEPEENE